jgi:hypothetical protein
MASQNQKSYDPVEIIIVSLATIIVLLLVAHYVFGFFPEKDYLGNYVS